MVTGVAMLLGLCAVSIQLLMRLNADVQGRYGAAVALERLARQLRDDAHASETAQIAADQKTAGKAGACAWCSSPIMSSSTSSGDGGVVRTESRAGKVVRHETYALPAGPACAVRASRRSIAPAGGAGRDAAAGQEPGGAAPAAGSGGVAGQGSCCDRRVNTGGKPQ